MFLFGPLTYVALLEKVLGRRVEPIELTHAGLAGFVVKAASKTPWISVSAQSGGQVDGILIAGLSEREVERLKFYHGGYGFSVTLGQVKPRDAAACSAQMFLPPQEQESKSALWGLPTWSEHWGGVALAAASEIMAQFGQLTAAQIAARLPGIHIRAAAYAAAQLRSTGSTRNLDEDVVVHVHHHSYSNFFAAQELDLQYRRYDGLLSPVINRGAQVLGQGAVVLPYDPVRDEVLLVEQFRAPLFMGGDRAPWLWQPVAGMVDPGEAPEEAARRESVEEAGLTLSELVPVAGAYSSPGSNSDFVNLYVGLGDFSTLQVAGGLAAEGEDIKVGVVGFDVLMVGVDQGRYRDLQLVTTALWLARHRDRLRIV